MVQSSCSGKCWKSPLTLAKCKQKFLGYRPLPPPFLNVLNKQLLVSSITFFGSFKITFLGNNNRFWPTSDSFCKLCMYFMYFPFVRSSLSPSFPFTTALTIKILFAAERYFKANILRIVFHRRWWLLYCCCSWATYCYFIYKSHEPCFEPNGMPVIYPQWWTEDPHHAHWMTIEFIIILQCGFWSGSVVPSPVFGSKMVLTFAQRRHLDANPSIPVSYLFNHYNSLLNEWRENNGPLHTHTRQSHTTIRRRSFQHLATLSSSSFFSHFLVASQFFFIYSLPSLIVGLEWVAGKLYGRKLFIIEICPVIRTEIVVVVGGVVFVCLYFAK